MTTTAPEITPARSLRPAEMAQAAVMAALCAATAIIAVVVPFAAGLSLLGTVPMGILAYRYRIRVLLAAAVAGGIIAFLIAGVGGFMTVVNCAYIGGLTGIVKRKGRGTPTVVAVSIVAGLVFGVFIVGALTVLGRLRYLIIASITANVEGGAKMLFYGALIAGIIVVSAAIALAQLRQWIFGEPTGGSYGVDIAMWLVGTAQSVATGMTQWFRAATAQWHWVILGYAVVVIMMVSLIGWWVLSRVIERLRGLPDVHKLDAPVGDGPPGPMPVSLHDVRFRYPGAEHDALNTTSIDIDTGEHVAVTGANGSGKTTLMLVLAGREPTSGTVDRPGGVGLGHAGGTAVVLQHPESQVLGSRVADDVVWGLPAGARTDVDSLLDEVGLGGMGGRDTGGLSGGELQRLAVAAALAREPALMIADEVTSMVDQKGREDLLGVLSGLTKHRQMSLVHITHYTNEAENADRVISLSESVDNTAMVDTAAAPAATSVDVHHSGAPLLVLDGVSHEYGHGTPWAKPALRDINFTVGEGDGLLIHGGNGSGKSTLAWIMAGLITPSKGRCLVDGQPADQEVGSVAVAFQAARLQLMRPRVDLEVASAAGFSPGDHGRVVAALAKVGLDAALARRRIDQLSGGQMRRVVLAGLLARSPRALILDEPLAGLDAASHRGLLHLLADLRTNSGLTIVIISHDFGGLQEVCPRILHLNGGVLEPVGTPAGSLT